MGKVETGNYTIELEKDNGEVVIPDEVVAVIAGLAAMDVDGVASLAGYPTREMISKLGKKALSKGVRIDILENVVTVVLTLELKYGYNVKKVATKVQEKVKTSLESMTELTVADVNIRVAGVQMEA